MVYNWDSVDLDTQDNWASDFVRGDMMANTPSPYLLEPADFEQMWSHYSGHKKIVVFAGKGVYNKTRQLVSQFLILVTWDSLLLIIASPNCYPRRGAGRLV